MNSKIVKISFVLVFILIVMGFFNSVFAFGEYNNNLSNFNVGEGIVDPSGSGNPTYYYNTSVIDVTSFPYISASNVNLTKNGNGSSLSSSNISDLNTYVINYLANTTASPIPVLYYIAYDDSSHNSYLRCDLSVPNPNNINNPTYSYTYNTSSSCYFSSYLCYSFKYYNGEWYRAGSGSMFYFNRLPSSGLTYSQVWLLNNVGDITFLRANNSTFFTAEYQDPSPSIDINVVQTGTSTGQVELTSVNWDSPHMYYVKDSMDELVRLIAEEELSPIHNRVSHYDGPIAIEHGEYVMAMLFDSESNMVFSGISDTVAINYNTLLDSSHKLYIDKENENIYYLSIHNYQNGDYLKICDRPITDGSFSTHVKILSSSSATLSYNGLFIGQAYETALHHINRKINLNQNGITYFYLYDSNDNLINSVVLNSSNYYSGEDFNFDVELEYGSSLNDNLHLISDNIRWVKIRPIISVPSIDKYELYLRISDYGNIPYNNEEDRLIFATHDTDGSNHIGIGIGTNSNNNWYRIDDKIYDYFYLNTSTYDTNFTFELQLRSASGQIIQTKTFNVSLSNNNKSNGTVTSYTDGKNDTYVRNSNELSNISQNASNFNFNGLNNLSELDLRDNLDGLIDNSVGFFGLLTTLFLLLPTWISTLLYFFFFGIIVITLFRFIRGA